VEGPERAFVALEEPADQSGVGELPDVGMARHII
jgi:hypothetical protein